MQLLVVLIFEGRSSVDRRLQVPLRSEGVSYLIPMTEDD